MINTVTYKFDTKEIVDWDSFHDLFSTQCHFPSYYGRNMDAWIDCVGDLSESDTLIIFQFENMNHLKDLQPEIFLALIDCASLANYREIEIGGNPFLLIAYV